MSEDDVDMLGPDGQGSSRVDSDRRAPRFSWTPAYETTFFRSLCDSVQLGLRENNSFKAEAWERAAQALQDCHGAYPAKSHLINKSDNARKRFRLWRGLREDPDFVYNPVSKTVTATEDAWRAHIEREPLSKALRGRPFDHEEYMEILYPDVIGSGGAPKRIMKPRRRTDGQPGDESEMPGTGVLHLQPEPSNGPTSQDSPGPAESSSSQTPTSTALPPRTATAQPSALTPPDEPANQAKKRALPTAQSDGVLFGTTPPPSSTYYGSRTLLLAASPGKRQRTSLADDSVALVPASSNNMLPSTVAPASASASASESPSGAPPVTTRSTRSPSQPPPPPENPTCDVVRPSTGSRWCEMALEQFFGDFADADMDLQIKIAENVLVDEMSYAEVAASGPKQTPEEAAAPQPVELVNNESASTASLIDVDVPSVRTVPSDFLEQDVQTDTQAERLEREAEAAEAAEAKAQHAKKRAAKKARNADSWITQKFASLSDGSAGALAVTNLAAVIGVSSYLGYKAWGLYERGNLNWRNAGVGFGILAGVGAVEAVLGRYLVKGKKGGS